MAETTVMVLVNLVICSAGAFMCACRMAHMSEKKTKRPIRVLYIVWFTTLIASALSWTYDEPPGIGQVSMSLAILIHLAMGIGVWRHGPPAYARR
jgi:membrane-anchored protein YejM (alkaline phosphatase superfamily)